MINVLADPLKAAGRILNRLKFTKTSLPVLSHLQFAALGDELTITATTLDQWLQTSIPLTGDPVWQESFLVPLPAFKAALKADKGSTVSFARKGRKGAGVVHLGVTTGGMTVNTGHPTLETDEFPGCPVVDGEAVELPARSIQMLGEVASCASHDETRHVLNGVFLTPDDGGMVVATDGRRLAAAPAAVPPEEIILPNQAVHVLGHTAFVSGSSRFTVAENDAGRVVRIESDDHLLISKLIDGNYANWKQVVPKDMVASATVAEEQRASLIKWLRGLSARDHAVLLERRKRSEIRLTQTVGKDDRTSVSVPAEITGEPVAVALNPRYLADALTIAPCLWIIDEMSPVVARRADGAFCVVMPMRVESPQARAAA